jgi:hypothetical protein
MERISNKKAVGMLVTRYLLYKWVEKIEEQIAFDIEAIVLD